IPRLSTHSVEVASCRPPSSKSNCPAATIQRPTSARAIRNESPAVAVRGSGSSATTSAPEIGSRMRAVVSMSALPHRYEDDDQHGDRDGDHERVRAEQSGLNTREAAAELERAAADLVQRALDDRLLDVSSQRPCQRDRGAIEERVVELVEVQLVLEELPGPRIGHELAARAERAPREHEADQCERHGDRARQVVLT